MRTEYKSVKRGEMKVQNKQTSHSSQKRRGGACGMPRTRSLIAIALMSINLFDLSAVLFGPLVKLVSLNATNFLSGLAVCSPA